MSPEKSGHLEPQEQQLIHRVFEFSDTEVREAMVPRMQVEALTVTATLEEVRATFLSTGYSRLPVYGERLDDIVGLLFRKDVDMGRVPAGRLELRTLVRPPAFGPATASLGKALKQMQASRVHFCFVVDEHGGMEGILTLEDLLEEIVGEINDEYDEETRSQIKKVGQTYVLDGMLAVRDANQRLGFELPEDGSYTTIAGFLLARAGRLLSPGDKVEHTAETFKIERVDKRRISRIRFVPANENEDQSVNFSTASYCLWLALISDEKPIGSRSIAALHLSVVLRVKFRRYWLNLNVLLDLFGFVVVVFLDLF